MSGSRLIGVYQTWDRLVAGRTFASRRAWWSALQDEGIGLGLACFAVAASAPMEATVWGLDWDPLGLRHVGRLPGAVVAGVLLGVWLASAVYFDGLLRVRVDGTGRPGAAFRTVRSLIAGFPGLGLTSIGLWRFLAVRRPRWAYGSPGPSSRRRARSRKAELLLPQPVGRTAFFLWLAGLGAFFLAVVWLAAPQEPDPRRRVSLVACSAALHGFGLIGTVAFTQTLERRGSARRHYLWAGAWLLPLPVGLAAFAPLAFDLRSRRQETLVWTAHALRGQATRLTPWDQMERSLRRAWSESRWWRRWRRPLGRRRNQGLAGVDRSLLGACRVKLALLLGDGLLLGWLLDHGGVALGRPPWIGCVTLVVVGGALAGLLTVLVGNLLAVLRLARAPAALGTYRQIWYVVVGLATLGVSLLAGSTLAGGQHRESGLLLTYSATLAQLWVGFSLILRSAFAPWSAEGAGAGLRWCAVCMAVMIAGACVAASPIAAAVLLASVFAMPLWHGLFFVSVRPLFDRCFEPGRSGSGTFARLTDRARTRVLAAGLLPLGGLAVASWLRLRQRVLGSGDHE